MTYTTEAFALMSCPTLTTRRTYFDLSTEAHIVYLALKICNMDNIDAEISGVDGKTPAEIVASFFAVMSE